MIKEIIIGIYIIGAIITRDLILRGQQEYTEEYRSGFWMQILIMLFWPFCLGIKYGVEGLLKVLLKKDK